MLKTYNFWIKLVAVLILIVRIVGDKFGFYVDSVLYMDIATALASVLVILGVIQVPPTTSNDKNNKKEGNVVREDITETLKCMAEKLRGLTDNFNSAKLAPITALMDEILNENDENCAKNDEKCQQNEEIIENEEILEEENDNKDCGKEPSFREVIEEEFSCEQSAELESYLIETELEREEVVEESEEEVISKEDNQKLLSALKEKIKALVEENIDDIISSLA